MNVYDFMEPRCVSIVNPEMGFFGYLLRCKCLPEEDLTGNVIFLDNGKQCFERFPKERQQRELRRKPWTLSVGQYQKQYVGQLIYVNEDKLFEFVNLMETAPDSEVQTFLTRFIDRAKCYPESKALMAYGMEPLFAVTHVRQQEKEGGLNIPHIHILWGKIKKKRK